MIPSFASIVHERNDCGRGKLARMRCHADGAAAASGVTPARRRRARAALRRRRP